MAAPLSEITAIVRDVTGDFSASTRFDELSNWDFMDLVEPECRCGLQFDLPEATIGNLRLIAARQAVALAG